MRIGFPTMKGLGYLPGFRPKSMAAAKKVPASLQTHVFLVETTRNGLLGRVHGRVAIADIKGRFSL